MDIQFSHIVLPTALAGLLGILCIWLILKRKSAQGSIPLALLFGSAAFWSICYAVELSLMEYTSKVFWLKMESIGVAILPVLWLFFCLRYVDIQKPKTSWFIIIFSIIPIVTLVLAFTNSTHHLVWISVELIDQNGLMMLKLERNIWFWIHTGYSHLIYLAGMYFLVQKYLKTPSNMVNQIRYVFLAGLIPGVTNIFYIFNNDPIPQIDYTPLSFAVSGLLIVWVLYYHRLLDIIPIARDTTIENMQDGIIVVDLEDRLVDINPAAEKIINYSFSDVIGQPASEILAEISDWVALSKESKTPIKVLNVGEGKNKKIYVLNLFPLTNTHDQLIGHSIMFHNNTQSYILNKNLKDQADRLAVLYEIGKAITSTIEIDELLELIYNQLSQVMPSDAYFVAIYIPDDHQLEIRILMDQGTRYPSEKVDADEGLSSWIVKNREPLLIHDLRKEINTLTVKPVMVGEKRLTRSWLGVPMQIENELIGLLAVASYQPNVFDEMDQLLLEQIAQQAVLSIQNARHHEEVTQQAKLDSLTGVSNHNHLIERLYEEAESALSTLTPLSLIMLDIDYFKLYNDTYGHIVGDQVLRLTVQAIQSHIKKTDTVGRWGGEEFGVILPNATAAQANIVANRIRQTLAELPLFDVEGLTIPKPTISQGIGTMPDHTSDVDELVIIADRALYRAKNKGRDQVTEGKPSQSS
ncbi:MAG: diguanylate cyclase [Anaerolineales bacterium]|nr:diguanylate cyclase [Anaerolineales bacterium]